MQTVEETPENFADIPSMLKAPRVNYDQKLPKLIESCLAMDRFQNTGCGKITLLLICVPFSLGNMAFFNVVTNALVPGIVLAIAFYVMNLVSLLQPDYNKPGVFRELLFSTPDMQKLNNEIRSGIIFFCFGVTLIYVLMYFLVAQGFSNTSTMYGEHTKILLNVFWWSNVVLANALSATGWGYLPGLMQPRIPHVWSTKVKNYVKLVRSILLDKEISAEVEDGLSRVDKKIGLLSKAQQQIDLWARDIDSGMSTYTSFYLCSFIFNILLGFFFIAFPGREESRLAVIITMSIWAGMALFGLLSTLSSIARPNQVWNRAKTELLADAMIINAVTKLGWSAEFWKIWINSHSCQAGTILGVKFTTGNLRSAGSAISSLFAIAFYLVLRDQLSELL